jgi:hypothetical protein
MDPNALTPNLLILLRSPYIKYICLSRGSCLLVLPHMDPNLQSSGLWLAFLRLASGLAPAGIAGNIHGEILRNEMLFPFRL